MSKSRAHTSFDPYQSYESARQQRLTEESQGRVREQSLADGNPYDVVIAGGSFAGSSAAARAQKRHLNYVVLTKGTLFSTLEEGFHPGKHVMDPLTDLPLRTDLPFQAGSREAILEKLRTYVTQHALNVHEHEPVLAVAKTRNLFRVTTPVATYVARNVILATGRIGNPRRLTVPGAELPHVVYRLTNVSAIVGQEVLIVGEGDSAAEAALALYERNIVTLCTRTGTFPKMNAVLRATVADLYRSGKLVVFLYAQVSRIEPEHAWLSFGGYETLVQITAHHVFVKIGAEMPRGFLEKCGVTFSSQDPQAVPVLDAHSQSVTPGLFVIGAATGRDPNLIKYSLNHGFEVTEHIAGYEIEPAEEADLRGRLHGVPGGQALADQLAFIHRVSTLMRPVPVLSLRQYVGTATTKRLQAGDYVFHAGDYCTDVHLLISGTIRVLFPGAPGKNVVWYPGAYLGLISALGDRRRSVTIQAETACILLAIPRRTLLTLMRSQSEVKTMVEYSASLRMLHLFCSDLPLSSADLHYIVKHVQLVRYNKQSVISHSGDPHAFFWILKGKVQLSISTPAPRKKIILITSGNECFDTEALLGEAACQERTIEAQALVETDLLRIDGKMWRAILAESRFSTLNKKIERLMRERQIVVAMKEAIEPDLMRPFTLEMVEWAQQQQKCHWANVLSWVQRKLSEIYVLVRKPVKGY